MLKDIFLNLLSKNNYDEKKLSENRLNEKRK